jgi:cyanophycinase-like exopeptidase
MSYACFKNDGKNVFKNLPFFDLWLKTVEDNCLSWLYTSQYRKHHLLHVVKENTCVCVDKENTNVIYISQISWKIIHKNKPFFDQWSKTIEDKLICMVRKNMKIHVLYTYHIRKRKMNERPANWSMQDYVHNKVINIPSHTKITYSEFHH